jgi:Sulfotransferase domain
MLPKFVVIGAPKAGSTYFHFLLRGHPNIFMPKPEDPYFEDPFYTGRTAEHFARVFRRAPRGSICGIKRPGYLSTPICAQRIAADLPDAKLIVTVRDPAARAISDYYHKMCSGLLPIVPLEIGMKKILMGEWNDENVQQVLQCGLYGSQIQQYLEYFPPERILVLRESSSAEARAQTKRLLADFLDIDVRKFPDPKNESKANVGVYDLRAVRVISEINKIKYNKVTSPGRLISDRQGIGRVVDLGCAAGIRVASFLAAKMTDNARPALSSDTLEQLRAFFVDDIRRLEQVTGYDFREWTAPKRAQAG